jgi:hypothetical protein
VGRQQGRRHPSGAETRSAMTSRSARAGSSGRMRSAGAPPGDLGGGRTRAARAQIDVDLSSRDQFRRAPDTLAQTGSDAGVSGRRRGPRAGRHRVVRRRLAAARTPAEPFDLLDAGAGAASHTRHTGGPSDAVRVGGISGRVGEAIGLRDTGRFFRIPAIFASPLGNASKVPCWRKNESAPAGRIVVSSAEDRT